MTTLTGHDGQVNYVAFTPDKDWLAAGDPSGNIKIWRSQPVVQSQRQYSKQIIKVRSQFYSRGCC
ncbi:hypothetical protein H6G35_14555 [Aulosira sp. FACHB-113]|uniref:hypothetical protein n=1 Tax=Tolypothrix tenuis TaxID=457083 RepID=UPI000BBBA1C5|nr:hypothetical protein [Aulosira sp. FACHB-113]